MAETVTPSGIEAWVSDAYQRSEKSLTCICKDVLTVILYFGHSHSGRGYWKASVL